MIFADQLEALEQSQEFGDGWTIKTITNMWATATGWLDAWMWGVLAALLVLINGIYLISFGRRTRT